MKTCNNCGRELPQTAIICGFCGIRFDGQPSAAPPKKSTALLVVGIILLLSGMGSLGAGIQLNNNFTAWLRFGPNPGTPIIAIGIITAIAGIALLVIRAVKK